MRYAAGGMGFPRRSNLLVLLPLFTAVPAKAQVPGAPSPTLLLEQARRAERTLDYEGCMANATAAAQSTPVPTLRAEANVQGGVCAFLLGDEPQGRSLFESALEDAPSVELPAHVSPVIASAFAELKSQVVEAQTEAVAEKSPPEPPPAERAPAGVSAGLETALAQDSEQASGRGIHPVTWALGGAAVASVGAGVFFGYSARRAAGEARRATFEEDYLARAGAATQSARNANIAFAGGAALLLTTLLTHWLITPGEEEARP